MAWLEAMASGKALVGGDVGPAREVIEDGASGVLCDPDDPGAIAKSVILVLTDDELRSRLESGARRRAIEHFSLEQVTEANILVYDRIASLRG